MTTDFRWRLDRARADQEITEDEMRAGLEFYITSTAPCIGCATSAHYRARQAIARDEWAGLERAYRAKLASLNERIERYGIKRAFLCYWDIGDDRFADVRIYNLLAAPEEQEMLQAWRYGAPFQLIENAPGLEGLSFMQRQVAAASALHVEATDDDERSEAERAEAERMMAIVSFLNEGDQAEDVRDVQDMLPEHLRIPEERIDDVTEAFTRSEEVAQELEQVVAQGGSSAEVQRVFNSARADRQAERQTRRDSHRAKIENRARKQWGIRDRFGTWWRQRGQPLRWERLSVRYSMTRSAYNEPIFTPKLLRTHPVDDEDFVPEVDLDALR